MFGGLSIHLRGEGQVLNVGRSQEPSEGRGPTSEDLETSGSIQGEGGNEF